MKTFWRIKHGRKNLTRLCKRCYWFKLTLTSGPPKTINHSFSLIPSLICQRSTYKCQPLMVVIGPVNPNSL